MENNGSDDLGLAVLGVAWALAGISIIIVIARFYVRLRIVRKFSVDDCIILFTLASFIPMRKHIGTLAATPERVMHTIKWVYLCEFFSIMCPGFGRISYAFLLLSITPPTKARRRSLWAVIGIQFVVDVGTVCISFSQCRPIEGFWDKSLQADCWDPTVQQYTGYFQGSVCSAVDLFLALFPCSLFWNLNMHWKQKAFLSALMGLGIFAMVASIVKTVQLRAITQTDDPTYAMAKLAIWWTFEAYFVLIAVSIPTIRPIFKNPKSIMRDRRSSNNTNTFLRWHRSHGNVSRENNGRFEPLHESTLHNEITGYEMGGTDTPGDTHPKGIRKDISV
ncbi:Uu.00g120130.m01.CDS01, partial [Anthostomella pinea]